jgi:hypothetical protein
MPTDFQKAIVMGAGLGIGFAIAAIALGLLKRG